MNALLESYNAAALAERSAVSAAAKAAEAIAQRAIINKAAADAEVDDFVLVGSNRPVDVAAAHGQRAL